MIKLIDYIKNFLEVKYENFSIENVLNYFNYYFSFENLRKNNISLKKNNEEFNLFDNELYLKESDCFYLYKQNDINIVFIYKNHQKNILKQINFDEFLAKKKI